MNLEPCEKMDPLPPPPLNPASITSSGLAAAARAAGSLDSVTLRRVLNERFLLARRVEREGMRRIFIACMLFVGAKFVRHKFMGKREDTSF